MIMLSQVVDGKNISTPEDGGNERMGWVEGKEEILTWWGGWRGSEKEEEGAGGEAGQRKWDLMNRGRQGASMRK